MIGWFLYGFGVCGFAMGALLAGHMDYASMVVGAGLIAASIVESRT